MTLSLMGIADASVHLHGVSTVQTRLEFVVGSLFEIKDKCMDELSSPFGLDFDNTQKLVLASSELFRLSRDLRQCHDGLDRAISKRVKGETKRHRYDQMKVRKRATVARHFGLLEQRSTALAERVQVLEELLRETPLEWSHPVGLVRQATMPASVSSMNCTITPNKSLRPAAEGLPRAAVLVNAQHMQPSGATEECPSSPLLRTGNPRTISPLDTPAAQSFASIQQAVASKERFPPVQNSNGSLEQHEWPDRSEYGETGHALESMADDSLSARDDGSTAETDHLTRGGTNAVDLGPSALLELLEGCESEASEVSVDSYGEPRDSEKAAQQQCLVQARAVVEQRLRGPPGAAALPSGGTACAPQLDSGSRQALQSIGLAGFALEVPEAEEECMDVQRAAQILQQHQCKKQQRSRDG